MKRSLDQFTVVYPKWQSYDVWLLRYGVQQTEFFVILDYFLPFYPLKTQGKFFLKKKKTTTTPGDIILHMCTINENHMMHGSWDIKAQGIEFLAIWGHFLPFDPLTTPKIKFLKKWKTLLEISSFYTSVHHKWQSYDVWFLKYEACRQNLSFSLFLPFYCSNSPKNQNKKKKNNLQVSFCT